MEKTEAPRSASKMKNLAGALLMVAISLIWLSILAKTGLPPLLVPWFIVFWLGFLLGIKNFFQGKDKALPPELPVRREEPDDLKNWLAFSYLSASSLVLFLLASVPLDSIHKPVTFRQVVDIQLTSFADYVNQNELLPSTEQKQSQKKRTGETQDMVNQENDPSLPSKNRKPARRPSRRPYCRGMALPCPLPDPKDYRQPTFFIAQKPLPEAAVQQRQIVPQNFPWRQYTAATQPVEMQPFGARVQTVSAAKPTNATVIDFEEVQPPQLLEITDNEGEIGAELWQAGGRTSGGKGAPSSLVAYLKEMHKKLKRTWTPSATSSRRAQILFRLRRDGTTATVKLIVSSGDPAVDQSALKAIQAATPFGRLPEDYLPEYLDVRYVFNYRADELTEVTAR